MKLTYLALLALIGLTAGAAGSAGTTGVSMSAQSVESEVSAALSKYKNVGSLGTEVAPWPQGQVGQPCHLSIANDALTLQADPASDGAVAQTEYPFVGSITKTVSGNLTTYTFTGSATPDGPGSKMHISGYLGLLFESGAVQVSVGSSARNSDRCLFSNK